MIKKSLLILFSGLSCFIFSSMISETPPDPTLFSKKFIETLKRNNQGLYVQTFEVTAADLDWLMKTSLSNPYLTEREKERIQEEIGNSTELKDKLKERLNENFEIFNKWIENDSINIDNIEFLNFYYELQLKKNSPFHVIEDGELFIKHGNKFYKINLDDVLFINNEWKYGEVDGIEEVDEHLNYISNDEYGDYVTDTAAAVTEVEAYDTTVVEPYYEDSYYPELNEKQAKKTDKIQKKIDALNRQKDEIYESAY